MMAVRPIWSGTIAFGLVVIPVKLYAATERKMPSFHLLHRDCKTNVKYLKWCPSCQRELSAEEIVKAVEYRPGEYVILTEEELESIPAVEPHKIEILDFVQLSEVDPVFFEKSFFLEPGPGAERAYALLNRTMRDAGKVAVARFSVRTKETLAVVRTYQDRCLMLETIYWADEVRGVEGLRLPGEVEVQERELAMARTLVDALSGPWDPAKYQSAQREAISDLVAKKVAGEEVTRKAQVPPGQVIDLMEALRQSVERARKTTGEASGKKVRGGRRAGDA